MAGDSLRLFFALWPEPLLARALAAASRDCGCSGRAMRTETLHLTLAFLGRVEANRLDELRIMGAAIDRPAFDFSLDRFGHWHHNRIVWAGCRATPEPLQDLATELRRCLDRAGIAYAAGVFVPHVTLLRDAHCPIQPVQPAPLAWTAREFRLVASEPGIRYRELACWSFR